MSRCAETSRTTRPVRNRRDVFLGSASLTLTSLMTSTTSSDATSTSSTTPPHVTGSAAPHSSALPPGAVVREQRFTSGPRFSNAVVTAPAQSSFHPHHLLCVHVYFMSSPHSRTPTLPHPARPASSRTTTSTLLCPALPQLCPALPQPDPTLPNPILTLPWPTLPHPGPAPPPHPCPILTPVACLAMNLIEYFLHLSPPPLLIFTPNTLAPFPAPLPVRTCHIRPTLAPRSPRSSSHLPLQTDLVTRGGASEAAETAELPPDAEDSPPPPSAGEQRHSVQDLRTHQRPPLKEEFFCLCFARSFRSIYMSALTFALSVWQHNHAVSTCFYRKETIPSELNKWFGFLLGIDLQLQPPIQLGTLIVFSAAKFLSIEMTKVFRFNTSRLPLNTLNDRKPQPRSPVVMGAA